MRAESRCHFDGPTGICCSFLIPIGPRLKPTSNATTNATFFIPYSGLEEQIFRPKSAHLQGNPR